MRSAEPAHHELLGRGLVGALAGHVARDEPHPDRQGPHGQPERQENQKLGRVHPLDRPVGEHGERPRHGERDERRPEQGHDVPFVRLPHDHAHELGRGALLGASHRLLDAGTVRGADDGAHIRPGHHQLPEAPPPPEDPPPPEKPPPPEEKPPPPPDQPPPPQLPPPLGMTIQFPRDVRYGPVAAATALPEREVEDDREDQDVEGEHDVAGVASLRLRPFGLARCCHSAASPVSTGCDVVDPARRCRRGSLRRQKPQGGIAVLDDEPGNSVGKQRPRGHSPPRCAPCARSAPRSAARRYFTCPSDRSASGGQARRRVLDRRPLQGWQWPRRFGRRLGSKSASFPPAQPSRRPE